jgi:sirohydrochlorin ferrochelatase
MLTTSGWAPREIGLLIVDHGSRRADSNQALLGIVEQFASRYGLENVEPAHMELAEPSIKTGFEKCVSRGARFVIVVPFFLLPGRHWDQDIPSLVAAAASGFPGTQHLVTAPLGTNSMMLELMATQISQCLQHVAGQTDGCDLCRGTDKCSILEG